jgi:hypothetical protein
VKTGYYPAVTEDEAVQIEDCSAKTKNKSTKMEDGSATS